MLVRPTCLSSMESFLAATPPELAAAALFVAGPIAQAGVMPAVPLQTLENAVIETLGLLAGIKVNSTKWFEALQSDAADEVRCALYEGLLFAEQRLCVWRRSRESMSIQILRRGQAVLTSGNAAQYLA